MVVFLTSSPTGPLDNSRAVEGIDEKNGLIENLRCRWRDGARCLLLAADPENFELNDMICRDMAGAFAWQGMTTSAFDACDDRWEDVPADALCSYDVLVLGGGHVPTQNAFFERIQLREKLENYEGMIIGISAGSMNSSSVVYAQPELPGESLDPGYRRFLKGLGLLNANILPHYQMLKDSELDGKRLFEEITYPDSYGRTFLALPDGSYLLSEDGEMRVFGEAYRICDGELEKICGEGDIVAFEDDSVTQ